MKACYSTLWTTVVVFVSLVFSARTAVSEILRVLVTLMVVVVPIFPLVSRGNDEQPFQELTERARIRGTYIIFYNQLVHVILLLNHSSMKNRIGYAPLRRTLIRMKAERDQFLQAVKSTQITGALSRQAGRRGGGGARTPEGAAARRRSALDADGRAPEQAALAAEHWRRLAEERGRQRGMNSQRAFQKFNAAMTERENAIVKDWARSRPLISASIFWYMISIGAAYGVLIYDYDQEYSQALFQTCVSSAAYFAYCAIEGLAFISEINAGLQQCMGTDFDTMVESLFAHPEVSDHKTMILLLVTAMRPIIAARLKRTSLSVLGSSLTGSRMRKGILVLFAPLFAIEFIPQGAISVLQAVFPPLQMLSYLQQEDTQLSFFAKAAETQVNVTNGNVTEETGET
jgi:hypothetical protein